MAAKRGLSKAEFVGFKSLNLKLRSIFTPEEWEVYKKLVSMSNDLNQLAHAVNTGQALIKKIMETMEAIDFSIDRLR